MRLILDSAAVVALEKNDRAMWRRFKGALLEETVPLTHGGIVGQTWRGRGSRQVLLARALAAVEIRALDEALGRAAGELLGKVRKNDVIDAALVLLATDGDRLLTSDLGDMAALAKASGREIELLRP